MRYYLKMYIFPFIGCIKRSTIKVWWKPPKLTWISPSRYEPAAASWDGIRQAGMRLITDTYCVDTAAPPAPVLPWQHLMKYTVLYSHCYETVAYDIRKIGNQKVKHWLFDTQLWWFNVRSSSSNGMGCSRTNLSPKNSCFILCLDNKLT